jgi:16S rRNA (cytosine1402-N4)-methyltransferase
MITPPFYHTTVLLQEAVDGLAILPGGTYVDATFGGGGHSKLILSKLNEQGRLIAFDQDADAWNNIVPDDRLIKVQENFRYMKRFLRLHQATEVDGILADLGVSSWQLDTASRGFSLRFDGPLDMRMDQRTDVTAATIIATYDEAQLHKLFELYGEVRNARQLAKHIVTQRVHKKINTIAAFNAMLMPVIKGNPNKYLAQVFQALRIEVNDELGALKDILTQAAACLKPGGRLSIITFHSLEDRIVKQYIKQGGWELSEYAQQQQVLQFKAINAKPIEPSEQEQQQNPRSRSARLRVAEKL